MTVGAAATSPQVNSITVSTAATESNTGNNTATDSTVISAALLPDLTISKSHVGSFVQGSTGNNYTVTVTNSGTGDKAALSSVSVTDVPPSGLTITAMSGPGWTCTTIPTCTRTDVLLAGNSYPAITVTVTVGAAATSPQVNSITVTTAATESNTGNNTTTDSTVITAALLPDLTITKSHVGSFVQGQVGATYTILVTNSGTGPTTGAVVTVQDTLPVGLTATAMSGSGWTCTVGTVSCTSTAIVAASSPFPAITLTVNVAANAAASVTNAVTVAGGGETNTTNDAANDPTVITAPVTSADAFQVRYAVNLTAGESVINMTNTGANGASLTGPGFGSIGNICVNVYAFSPDEQLISCCSCLITPNGLATLSVNADLINNTLTGVKPNSVVVKLVNTAAGPNFTANNCANSASTAGGASFPLAGGMRAYGTTIHIAPVAGTFGVTETPFIAATLSPAELVSITNRCTNIVGNGSGFGICRSCRAGGSGSVQ